MRTQVKWIARGKNSIQLSVFKVILGYADKHEEHFFYEFDEAVLHFCFPDFSGFEFDGGKLCPD